MSAPESAPPELDWASLHDSWIGRLAFNLIGYCTIIVPGYLLIKYFKSGDYEQRAGERGCLDAAVRSCVHGSDGAFGALPTTDPSTAGGGPRERSPLRQALVLMFCVAGLLGSYLSWGVLQEKIMTKEYDNGTPERGRFSDSQFLVFVNRVFALLLSALYLLVVRHQRHRAPLYKYSYCSFSNIMSSWCQYEALKFVSFPTQVLAKASKIIPVMLMGKVVSKNKYEYFEYVVAILISIGMTFFLMGATEEKNKGTVTTFSGILILIGYMVFDSFTSNWQNALYKEYSVSSVQMMCGVNLFSCLFTTVSLLQQNGFVSSAHFMVKYPTFMFDCMMLSVFSAAGQMFIYYTISQFGAVVFTIIMTMRQGLAILISCLLYQHAISPTGVVGILIVFSAIFFRIFSSFRLRQRRAGQAPSQGAAKV
ncbi:adenosine 3'-phospho 5'-phosphosulfate transporter 1-like [Pollicipes pollicipes]|uniref:adenosine 3'-phospho 5'-phosphosulfate transporter 1-like n=1 Tax=Pollicipes pollicipes TaxID=41117 RepID=UPI00188534B9|nr:adenosine 3'-phospho 5'-phosphosulfate transporter 1-like [Pollicipes pollicipes]XP_037072062.1 adenosine 3'-phospho 5'-phosphosulfate transporter 1-like [Pollicipes pollicipes]XP_037072063.1 adenosine 3'-phospho 5'-phosphosulfate transporter 1-like [Pollicipes pollicipes]XP_037072064.1 adenosine 3'-phospho 5'-phosphosulfate transporter 1-like [Pollicipes pollicipes]